MGCTVQKGSLDAPEGGGTSSPETPPVEEPQGDVSVHGATNARKNLKELSFAGAIMQPERSVGVESASSKKLQSSQRIKKGTPPLPGKQSSIGTPPVAKDGSLNHVFSFPRVVAAGDTGDNLDSLEANHELMADMVKKHKDDSSLDGLESALKNVEETFNDLLEKMSGSEMVNRAIQDITAYGDDVDVEF